MNHHSHVLTAPAFSANLDVLRRRWRLILAFAIMGFIGAGMYLSFAPPQYTSTALLVVDPRVSASFSSQAGVNDASMASARVESQVEIIRSEQITQTVVEKLELEEALLRPGFLGRLGQQVAPALEYTGLWHPEPVFVRSVAASAALAKHLSVRRLGSTYTIEIAATMPSAEQSAIVVNTVAEAYMELQRHLGEDNARRTAQLLQASTNQLRGQARSAEKAVEELKLSGTLNVANPAASKGMLRDLESSAIAYRNLYDRVLERAIETSQQQLVSLPGAQVVSPGRIPYRKSGPNTLLTFAAALVLSLSVGTAFALYRG